MSTVKRHTVKRHSPYRGRVGKLEWSSYKPGRNRLYQLQKIDNIHGGVQTISP